MKAYTNVLKESDFVGVELDVVFLSKKAFEKKSHQEILQIGKNFPKTKSLTWISFGDDFVDPFLNSCFFCKHHKMTQFQFGRKIFLLRRV